MDPEAGITFADAIPNKPNDTSNNTPTSILPRTTDDEHNQKRLMNKPNISTDPQSKYFASKQELFDGLVKEKISALREKGASRAIEQVYRAGVLMCRAKLYGYPVIHRYAVGGIVDPDLSLAELVSDLNNYTRAVDEFRAFRAFDHIPADDKVAMELWAARATLKELEVLLRPADEPYAAEFLTEKRHTVQRLELDCFSDQAPKLVGAYERYWRQSAHGNTPSGIDLAEVLALQGKLKARTVTALAGGLAFIAPMLIMVLHPTRLTRLLTSSLFVVFVATVLAVFMEDADPKDVVAVTAAYAAVLVVFVGTSTP